MAIIYPSYEEIKSLKVPPTEGEFAIIDFLLNNLSDEYEIFFQPFLNGDIPDLILMRKGGGVLIIEVKDWNLDSYHLDYRKKWYVSNNNALIKSPISQVLKYKENMYDLHIDHLLELKLRDYKYWFVVNCALFFYKEKRLRIQEFLLTPFEKQEEFLNEKEASDEAFQNMRDSKESYVSFLDKNIDLIGYDTLNEKDFNSLLYKRWISRKSYYFNDDLYNSFKRYLKPSFHSYEDGKNINLTSKQKSLAESKPGEQKIKGLVGSGKTLVLARRAVNAHIRSKEAVLILTYNISLKNYIHDKISDVRENFSWKFFHIINYHDFINSMMNNLGIEFEIPPGFNSWEKWQKENFFHEKYYANLELFSEHKESIQKYNTILVDEVQDYHSNWLRIIKKDFLKTGGEFVVFGDSKQDIYNRVQLVGNKKELVIPDSPGRWAELNESFRLTPTISLFASSFQEKFLTTNHNPDKFENIDLQAALFDKVHYKYFGNLDYEKVIDFIISFSRQLGAHPNDICILASSIKIIRELDYIFRQKTNEDSYVMSETKEYFEHLKNKHKTNSEFYKEISKIRKNKKLHFWMNSGKTKFSTIHSYKGWEIQTLFLIANKNTVESTYKELIYTGFTRCMSNLVIINIDDEELDDFSKELQIIQYE